MWILILVLTSGYNQVRTETIQFLSFESCKEAAELLTKKSPRTFDQLYCVKQ